MLNIRPIDKKFYLSGGWEHVERDCKQLAENGFKAILDLQYTPQDYTETSRDTIRSIANAAGLDYFAIPMADGGNQDLSKIYEIGEITLGVWDKQFTEKRDKILIKCGVGISRSVSMLIYFYCIRDRLTFTEARNRIQNADRNQTLLPVGIDYEFEIFLKKLFPDLMPQFGVKGTNE